MSELETKGGPVRLPTDQRTTRDGSPVTNRILASIPEAEFHVLSPLLTVAQFPQGTRFYEPGGRIEFAYFPNRGIVSLIVAMRDGKTVEVGVVGSEGLLGSAAIFGRVRSPHRAVMYTPSEGVRIRIDALLPVLPSVPHFHFLLSRHAILHGLQAAQSAACNRLHGAEQRLARWLLVMHERTDDTVLRTTHDFLATMLGTDRPSVSLAAAHLQRKGAIVYSRGSVRIADRQKLEESVCECYEVLQQLDHPEGTQ